MRMTWGKWDIVIGERVSEREREGGRWRDGPPACEHVTHKDSSVCVSQMKVALSLCTVGN